MVGRVLSARLETRSVIWTSVCLLAGMLIPQLISFSPRTGLQALLFVTCFALIPRVGRRGLKTLLLGAFCFMVALITALTSQLDPRFEGDSLLVDVRIVDFPLRTGRQARFLASPIDETALPARLRLRWFEPPVEPRAGDVWRLELRLKRPRGRMNPGGTDFEARQLSAKVGAVGYVVAGRHNQLLDSGVHSLLGRLRSNLDARIGRVVDDPDTAAVIAAIGIGARHRLSPDRWQRYADTGTSHLMAISGLHVGLAAVGAYALVRLGLGACGVGRRPHDTAILAGVVVAVLYALLSGFAMPAQRATLMLLVAAAAVRRRREVSGLQVLAVVAAAVSIADPLATLSAGFKLSFGAVLILVLVARARTAAAGHWLLRPFVAATKLARAQTALFLGLMPLTVALFSHVSLTGPLVNYIAVPVFGTITVPLTLVGLACGGNLEPIGDRALSLAAVSVTLLDRLIDVAAASGGVRAAPAIAEGYGFVVLLPLAWVALPPGLPGRIVAWLGVLGVVVWRPPALPESCARLNVLDVGHGLAVVIETRQHTLLYDTGPAFRGGGSAASSTVLPFLAAHGIDSLDRLVISHADNDHSGGLRDLLAGVPVDRILAGERLSPGIGADDCAVAGSWQWDGVRFEFLHPQVGDSFAGNDASCVLLVSAGQRSALLTGDIESNAEAWLVRRRVLRPVEWLTVPHHGSRTSSTAAFVQAVVPRVAIVSSGHANRWGMPMPEITARWQAAGARVFNTAINGAVGHTLCGDRDFEPAVGYRDRNGRLWHRIESLRSSLGERRLTAPDS